VLLLCVHAASLVSIHIVAHAANVPALQYPHSPHRRRRHITASYQHSMQH
jgi:hypothetical protein